MRNAMINAGLDPGGELIPDGIMHRFDAPEDRPNSKNGWYVLHDGDLQAGHFGSWKTGHSEKWCSKTKSEFTPADKKAYAEKMESINLQRKAETARVNAECQAFSENAWTTAPPATDDHPYLIKKQVKAHGLKLSGQALMVPVRQAEGSRIHGLQYIFPDGSKKFKTGTAKKGHFHLIGRPSDSIIICEGYATGASIYEATGIAVVVAFDSGNLKEVAQVIRARKPEIKVIIAADNDQWTAGNPGIKAATEAATAVNGVVVYPVFSDLTTGKPTDFNDLSVLQGADEIRHQFLIQEKETVAKITFSGEQDEEPPHPADMPYMPGHDEEPQSEAKPTAKAVPHDVFTHAPFLLLGYSHGDYYYLPKGAPQIKTLKPGEHSKPNLLSLAELSYWERAFPAKNGFDQDAAINALLQVGNSRGVYNPDKIRGRGAWEDEGRSVLHVGDSLLADGKQYKIGELKTEYIYEASISMQLCTGNVRLPNAEAIKLEQLCESLSWEKPISGKLLAGWCVASFICGGLQWRPHIHITGGAGSGKSWIIENIVRPAAGSGALVVQGATTEAGIRQSLGNDARPVIYDEAEGEDKNALQRMQNILELARQASSEGGGCIFKGSTAGKAQSFRIRSCFCFSSIGVSSTQQADQSRISVLSLRNNSGDNTRFKNKILPLWKLITKQYWNDLRVRTTGLIPIIRANAEIFSDVITILLESKRAGDQLGTLLACTWSLHSTNLIDREQAEKFASSCDWSEHVLINEQSDERRLLSVILETLINLPNGNGTISVSELIGQVSDRLILNETDEAHQILKRHGIKVIYGGFIISNSHSGIKKMLEKTPWICNWSKILRRLPGAMDHKQEWFSGSSTRATMLPITYINGEA